jgi:hypothetical protein
MSFNISLPFSGLLSCSGLSIGGSLSSGGASLIAVVPPLEGSGVAPPSPVVFMAPPVATPVVPVVAPAGGFGGEGLVPDVLTVDLLPAVVLAEEIGGGLVVGLGARPRSLGVGGKF